MDSALGLRAAAPTSRARIFSNPHRRGAGNAADGLIPLIVKRIVGNVVLHDVTPQVLRRPAGQWVDLDQTKLRISLDDADVRARGRLLAPDACDPGAQARQHLS